MHAQVDTGRGLGAAGRVVGPFAVLDRHFVVASTDEDLVAVIADGYTDLRADADGHATTVYRIERSAPSWHHHGWSITRDGELVAGEASDGFIPTLIPSDFARHVSADTATSVAITGVALARHGRAVVLTVDVVARDHYSSDEAVDLPALSAQAMGRGWSLVALDVVSIDTTARQVRAFHRPFAVEPGTPLAGMAGSGDRHRLIPASTLGALTGPTDLASFVAVRVAIDPEAAGLEPASPPAMLRALAAQLAGGPDTRRQAFHRIAALVEHVPGTVLHLGRNPAAALDLLEELA